MPEQGDKLTAREKAYVKARVRGKNKKDAAIEAGATGVRPDQVAYKLEKSIEQKDEGKAALIRAGLSLDVIIEKYIKPALNGDDKTIMLRATHMVLMMHGAYKAEQQNELGAIKCVIINGRMRPPRKPAIEIPFQPPRIGEIQDDADRAS
jgi:hypothetical protein